MTFLKRSCTTLVGLPAVVLVVYFGGLPLLLLCGFAALLGLHELYRAFSLPRLLVAAGMVFTVANFAAVYFLWAVFWQGPVVLMLFLAIYSVMLYGKTSLQNAAVCLFGFLYVPFMLTFVVLVREFSYGHLYVWIIFIACFGCDTFAYLFGSAFGKRKLTGTPSPSKTVEGLVGGIVSATVLGFMVPFFFGRLEVGRGYGITDRVALLLAFVTFACAVFSIFGDMFGSLIKRNTGIKDFGNFFPGHGGVMDRIDSIVFVAPLLFVVLYFMEWVFG